jgi:MoaA/NifB/PqqE/SkfB family radical SAM enzyme
VAVLVSGGEPLLRKDAEEIISALRTPERAPYIAMTTNGWLLTPERYQRLRAAGVDRFSVSLDYPDERHDEFRGIPGLFERIRGLIKGLDGDQPKAINISCVVQRDNFRDLKRIAELGVEWDVRVNFSTYTPLRTGDEDYLLGQEDLPEFKSVVSELVTMKKQHKNIRTSDYVFGKMIEFFETGGLPDCLAGERYFVVNPDGTFSPCGLVMRDYTSLEELREKFTKHNACGACYTSLRADCERPLRYLATDTIDFRT